VCVVPGLIIVVWSGRLYVEGFCGLCGCIESSVNCVFVCHSVSVGR